MQCLHSEIIKIKSKPSSTVQNKDQKVDRIEANASLSHSNSNNNTRNRSKEGSRLQSHDDRASENQEISDSSGIFSQSPGSAAGQAVVTGMEKPKKLCSK